MAHDGGMSPAHLPMLVIPAVAAAGALWHDVRRRVGTVDIRGAGPTLLLAATTVVAAAVHAWVCPEHFGESTLYGTFFVVAAVAQTLYVGWVLLRPRRWLLRAGVAANIGFVTLWLVTRLVAVPLGPDAGAREAFGVLDVVTGSAELLAAAAAAWLLHEIATRRRLVLS